LIEIGGLLDLLPGSELFQNLGFGSNSEGLKWYTLTTGI